MSWSAVYFLLVLYLANTVFPVAPVVTDDSERVSMVLVFGSLPLSSVALVLGAIVGGGNSCRSVDVQSEGVDV